MVGRLGFEPGMTEPKPVVLPLHHRPIAFSSCKGRKNLAYYQIFPILLLFYRDQVIVLLTLLGKQVLTVNQVFCSDSTVLIGKLLLVQ